MYANSAPFNKNPETTYPYNKNSELMTSSEENLDDTTTMDYQGPATEMQTEISDISLQVATETPWELIQQDDKTQKLLTPLALNVHAIPILKAQKVTALTFRDDQVRVVIHNVTQLTEEDVQQKDNVGAGMSSILYDEDVNEKM